MDAKLESPSARLKDSYISLVEEFHWSKEPLIPFVLKYSTDDFPAFIDRLEKCSQGSEIPSGFVAHKTFWLVSANDQVLGVSNLRFSLTESLRKDGGHIGFSIRPSARRQGFATIILKETLFKARELGITSALVTAHRGNTGSVRAILKNGGVLDSEERLPGHDDLMQRFLIPLD
jgi:predicted acetyltransferase